MMIKTLKLLKLSSAVCILITLGLVGCTTVIKHVPVFPDDSLLENCTIITPPEENEYFTASWMERESMLTEAYINQTLETAKCNARLESIRKAKLEITERLTGIKPDGTSTKYGISNIKGIKLGK